MEPAANNRGSPPGSAANDLARYGMQLSVSNIIQAPVSALFEYLRTRSDNQESESLIGRSYQNLMRAPVEDSGNNGEVTIRIIGTGEMEHDSSSATRHAREGQNEVAATAQQTTLPTGGSQVHNLDIRTDRASTGESASPVTGNTHSLRSDSPDGAAGTSNRDSSYQRYDMQQAARWIEHILPFTLLLLIVFIRQHLQGFFVTIWIAVVMFKSNDILRKQTALKGERKLSVLIGYSAVFALHVVAIYWWYRNDNLLYTLLMLPPKVIPPFWNAIFIIVVNDILVRQAAMIIKCMLLIYYKNSKGRNYRRQGQLLTMIEYMLLLYRGLLPAPVWYRFFLNKEYGSLFSSLITGLYLTIKLTTIVEKVQNFVASVKALSRKEIQYGAYATLEQVNAAGDLCAICQEKMHAPILLRCKHLFCEDCVSEWFERERTCPLCRALVKPAELKSFGDGSTGLFFQLC